MGTRPILASALAAGLLLGCRSTPPQPAVHWEGLYEFQAHGSSSYPRGTISLQWGQDGYRGYLTSTNRDLELVESTGEAGSIQLRFERDGVRIFIVFIQRDAEIVGTWREMGSGGPLRVTRVSP